MAISAAEVRAEAAALLDASANAATISLDGLHEPRIEPEVDYGILGLDGLSVTFV